MKLLNQVIILFNGAFIIKLSWKDLEINTIKNNITSCSPSMMVGHLEERSEDFKDCRDIQWKYAREKMKR